MTDLKGRTTTDAPTTPILEPGPWLFPVYLLLGGYLLFAHGCHGDEDNELFNWLSQSGPAAGTLSSPR